MCARLPDVISGHQRIVCHSYEAIGCCKHASVYSLDNYTNSEGVQVTRMSFNAVVEPSDMKQTCALLLCASVVSRVSPPGCGFVICCVQVHARLPNLHPGRQGTISHVQVWCDVCFAKAGCTSNYVLTTSERRTTATTQSTACQRVQMAK